MAAKSENVFLANVLSQLATLPVVVPDHYVPYEESAVYVPPNVCRPLTLEFLDEYLNSSQTANDKVSKDKEHHGQQQHKKHQQKSKSDGMVGRMKVKVVAPGGAGASSSFPPTVLEVPAHDSVSGLRSAVLKEYGLAPEMGGSMRLLLKGKVLSDSKRIEDYPDLLQPAGSAFVEQELPVLSVIFSRTASLSSSKTASGGGSSKALSQPSADVASLASSLVDNRMFLSDLRALISKHAKLPSTAHPTVQAITDLFVNAARNPSSSNAQLTQEDLD